MPPPPLPPGKAPERKPDIAPPAKTPEAKPGIAPPVPPGEPPKRKPDVREKDSESSESKNNRKEGEATEKVKDDGWEAIFDPAVQQYYFYNKYTNVKTWKNPRVPEAKSTKDLLMERLSSDPAFQALSKFEKVQRYQDELAKLEDSDPEADSEPHSPSQQKELMKDFKLNSIYPEDTNNVNTLANMISQGRSLKAERKKAKITKQQLSEYKRKREERKKKNMDKFFA